MSQRKILFFVISIVVVVSIVIAINAVNTNQKKVTAPKELTIWINEGTSESYKDIIAGFKEYAPDYAKTTITIEKKPSDASQYRTLLLNTIADGGGPDIFVTRKGEDAVLDRQIEPIPSDILPLNDFEKRYDDIFLPLITSTGSEKNLKEYLLGVPLGYETLGIFYNKALIPSVPKTWNELDTLYSEGGENGKIPSNLGLGPRYTPSISEILALLFGNKKIISYKEIGGNDGVFSSYFFYGSTPIGSKQSTTDDVYAQQGTSLSSMTTSMDKDNLTTLDLFVRGDIGMIIGFPSSIVELEKAQKRAGTKATNDIILTEKILQDSTGTKRKNLAQYSFFAISKNSKNGKAAAKFLEYLMTEDAEQKYLQSYPYQIPAQRKFYASVQNNKISKVYSYAKLNAFVPSQDETLFTFDYGLKSEFDIFLDKYIDRENIGDINNLGSSLSLAIRCAVAPYIDKNIPANCENVK